MNTLKVKFLEFFFCHWNLRTWDWDDKIAIFQVTLYFIIHRELLTFNIFFSNFTLKIKTFEIYQKRRKKTTLTFFMLNSIFFSIRKANELEKKLEKLYFFLTHKLSYYFYINVVKKRLNFLLSFFLSWKRLALEYHILTIE